MELKEFSGFFNGVYIGDDEEGKEIYDREYDSDELSFMVGSFFGNGVYPNPSTNLLVQAMPDMNIKVLEGQGFINGRYYRLLQGGNLKIDDSDVSLIRIDRVVLRSNLDERTISLKVIKGTPSSRPVAPSLVRTDTIHDLGLAEITVNANAKEIKQSDIRDTRHIQDICGIVATVIKDFDTSELFIQYEEALKKRLKILDDILMEEDVAGKIFAELDKKQNKILEDEATTAKYVMIVKNGRPYLKVVEI